MDVATGPGFVGVEFAKKGFEVVGTDITREMLSHAKELRKRKGVQMEFVLAEATHQPFRYGAFDIAVSRLAFHHMRDPANAVESMKSLVEPEGRIIVADLVVSEDDEVADFHNGLERLRDPSHVRSLKLSEWKRVFQTLEIRLDRVALSKVRLELVEWAKRAGFPVDRIPDLARMLEKAPVRARRSLRILSRNGMLSFLNTRAILAGTRTEKSSDSAKPVAETDPIQRRRPSV